MTPQPTTNKSAPKYPIMLPEQETNNSYGITAKAYLTYEQAFPEETFPEEKYHKPYNQFKVKRVIIW
jgi:hypothetical protein